MSAVSTGREEAVTLSGICSLQEGGGWRGGVAESVYRDEAFAG